MNIYRIDLMRGSKLLESKVWTRAYVSVPSIYDAMKIADGLIIKPKSWNKWSKVQINWYVREKILYELYVQVQLVNVGDTDGLISVINAESPEWLRK